MGLLEESELKVLPRPEINTANGTKIELRGTNRQEKHEGTKYTGELKQPTCND